ncbi:MAG: flagellar hook-associated protein FlgK [Rhodospirillales bacterium RIFCSPLOWO2_12_FULL_58_28]|nr:MAG: flagellar hook-associated protein FlgK [Rhodospirillales bacterium RIFCSPLOWO2_02_FULL_58_16]OHC78582.1 MAG: flagellar hook-associated protein FlgK [Rhodospirillales bacterium RIFCSPLOWO2_12_FULL_58_28]
MSALTLSLLTAQSGLTVNQAAMDATAENIANANAADYTRKAVTMEQRVVAGVGAGVQLGELKRQIDEGLLKSMRLEMADLSKLDVQTDFYERIQYTFGSPEDNTSIAHIANQFNGALEAMALSPDSVLQQSEVLRWANELEVKSQDMTSTIQELRMQADNDIATAVGEINTLILSIRDYNDLLISSKAVNREVSDIMDQRDKAMNRLSELIDSRYYFRGDGDMVVFTASGRTLVDNIPATLVHTAVGTSSPTTTHADGSISGIYIGEKIAANDITEDIGSGALSGLITLRDDVLADLQSQLDEMMGELRDLTNQIHNRGAAFPGAQTMTGTRNIINSSAQTIKLDPTGSVDDVVIAAFDISGDQQAKTTLNAIMQDATIGVAVAYSSRGASGDWTIDRVAAKMQAWLRDSTNATAPGPGLAAATVTVNSAGHLQIDLNDSDNYLAFRDQAGTAAGAALEDAEIAFSAGGADYTGVTFANVVGVNNDTMTFAAGTDLSYLTAGATFTINGAANAANNGSFTVVSVAANVITVTSDALVAEAVNVALTTGATETVRGFSNFFGLNDFFVDGLPDNIWETDVMTSTFSGTAATLSIRDDNGLMGAISIAATAGLSTIRDQINNANMGVTATLIPDGSGIRLRLTHDTGKSMYVTQATGNTLLTDIGMHLADVRTAGTFEVRSDIKVNPGFIAHGAVQWDADLGPAGEYFTSVGDDTIVEALAKKLNENNQFDAAGGLAGVNHTIAEYAEAILERNSSQAHDNKTSLDFQQSLTESLQGKSDSYRGVNLDEELANLLVYEQAYSAAARIISVIQSMFDALEQTIG